MYDKPIEPCPKCSYDKEAYYFYTDYNGLRHTCSRCGYKWYPKEKEKEKENK